MGKYTIKVTEKTTGVTKEIQTTNVIIVHDGGVINGAYGNVVDLINFLSKCENAFDNQKQMVAKRTGIPIQVINAIIKECREFYDSEPTAADAEARA